MKLVRRLTGLLYYSNLNADNLYTHHMKALIIGKGKVGTALARLIEAEDMEVCFFSSRSDRSMLPALAKEVDACFLAIPTDNTGTIALAYIAEILSYGKPIVTCEKASLANHFEALLPHLSRIGFSATVGGGSGLLSLVRSSHFGIDSITGVVNATLNFLVSEIARGRTVAEVVDEAITLGLCEPGHTNLVEIVNAEIQDMLYKSAILFNLARLTREPIHASEFSYGVINQDAITGGQNGLLARVKTHRFAVTIKERMAGEKVFTDIPGFAATKEGWVIRGSYQPVRELENLDRIPRREENALVVTWRDGARASLFGIGAGPLPTAAAMLGDARRLVDLH